MHTISTESDGRGLFRFRCSCGATGSWVGHEGTAWNAGLVHKEEADSL